MCVHDKIIFHEIIFFLTGIIILQYKCEKWQAITKSMQMYGEILAILTEFSLDGGLACM